MAKSLGELLATYLETRAEATRAGQRLPLSVESVERLGRRDSIRTAMEYGRKLAFFYARKRDGVEGHYVTAPYSMRDVAGREMLYATDHKHGAGQIHSFILGRVAHAAVIPGARYHPVWTVEPESV